MTDEQLALQCRALAHPARLEVLRILACRGTCVCGAIVEVMPLAQSTVSQHLKVLKEAALIQGTIEGPRSCYCLDQTTVRELRRTLDLYLGEIEAGAQARTTTPAPEETLAS